MTEDDLIREWLEGVTYRPGWKVQGGGTQDGGVYIVVEATEPDVCNPDKQFQTGPLFRVPDEVQTRDQFYDWIIDVCIPGVETHERWEWFRINGRHHRDPHAPGMPAFAVDFPEVGWL